MINDLPSKTILGANVELVRILNWQRLYLGLMKFISFFHELRVSPEIRKNQAIQTLFSQIKTETENNKPYYSLQSRWKILIQVDMAFIDGASGEEHYFVGKMIKSEKDIEYGKEKDGELSDLEVENGTGIYHKGRGVVFFLLYINTKLGKYVLMLEDVPFSMSVGTFVRYINERLKISFGDKNEITSFQLAGKDFVSYLNSIGGSQLLVARIQLKKYVNDEDMEKIGEVQEILKAAKDKTFSTELRLVWDKRRTSPLSDFLKKLLKKEQISDIAMTNFSEIFRVIRFELENSAQPNVNLLNRLLKFEIAAEKMDMSDKGLQLHQKMIEGFKLKKEQII